MSALKVLFIGGSGQISSACSQRAVDLGIDLYVLNRGRTSVRPLPAAVRRLEGDIRDPASARAAIGDREFDAVVDFVAFTPEHVQARRRPLHRAHRPVRLHQLGVGLSEARRPAADRRVHAAAQPGLALLAGQDRLRGAARARLSRGRLPGDDRAALAHLRPHEPALRGRLDGGRAHAPGQGGRRPRRRHVAVDAHPSRRLRQGLRRAARPSAGDRRQLPHHLRRGARRGTRSTSSSGPPRARSRASSTSRPTRSSRPTSEWGARCWATRRTR